MIRYRAITCRHGRSPAARRVFGGFEGFAARLACLACVLCGFSQGHARAQALPAATANPISTGFELPRVGGSFSYSVSGYESFSSGFYSPSGFQSSTGVSGNIALITASKADPFSMVLSTGRSWSNSGEPSPFYLNFGASQVINLHRWNAMLSDSVGYFPATPSVGLSGIPGTGDLSIPPVQSGVDTGQGILTSYATRLSNNASAGIGRQLTAKSSANFSGTYSMFRFVGNSSNSGLDSDSYSAGASYSYALNARSNLSGNYSYSIFKYSSGLSGYKGQTVDVGYSRQISRRLSMDVFLGPQWTMLDAQVSPVLGAAPYTGTTVNLFVSTDLTYSTKTTSYSAGYSRGTNGGYGALPGGRSDSLRFTASKTFDRVWNAGFTSAYTHTSSLANYQSFAGSTFVVGGQLSRALGRNFSTYGSYTLEKQTSTGSTAGVFNLFSGSFQVVSVGVTYSPRPRRIGAH